MFDIAQTIAYWSLPVITEYTLSTVIQPVAAPQPQRAILYLTNGGTVTAQLAIDPVPPASGPGHFAIPAGGVLRFTYPQDGPLSTYPWVAWVESTTTTLWVVEIFWRPK